MTDPQSPLVVRIDVDRRINYAMQQNDVPVVKALHIENRTDATLRDLQVRICAEPAFAQGWITHVASIGEKATYNVEAIDLQLSPGFLGQLTERVRGQLWIEVAQGDEVLTRFAEPVELLARDEWSGLSSLPEVLAAFVLPNHPAIEPVLRTAAGFLSDWTGDPSLDGYKSKDGRRVHTMAGAVYAALQKQNITYVNPPASFEEEGQRVRLPDRVLESRMATCLDLALLTAACLEQAGLNALVVFVEEHAFTGVWLDHESFPEPAMPDGLRLRKRVDLNEITVFDPTGVTARPTLTYEQAVAEARKRLEETDSFLCAIDVCRARKGRVRPLPERVERPEAPARSADWSRTSEAEPPAPDVSRLGVDGKPGSDDTEKKTESPATRLDRWRRKLLDLSLRNRLLNFKDTKKTLPLMCPDLGVLEDMLAGGETFRLHPRLKDLAEGDLRDMAAHRRRTGQDGIDELLLEELKARRLHTDTTPEELDRRQVEIYRAARLGLEEGGASALYLAIGFLSWYETEKSEQPRLAPILLLPIELKRKSIRGGVKLRLSDDDPRINVTLLEMLKQDHGITIPGLDPLPEDDSGLDVPLILRTVRQAVRDVDRWEVIDEIRIGLFSFTKFLMWRDLSERAADLMKNRVVEHLINRPDQPFDSEGSFPQADRLDEERSPEKTYCPLPADSSQLAAVFAAAEGRSFVLEGPPGTGKSQTITNLIAHCLAEGKTILFVSEKMAALNVVHRRLGNVGLGRYCLELHSNKAHKREVVGQLEEALQRFDRHSEEDWTREALRLASLRNELNAYAEALHRKRSTGETVFQATSRLIGLRKVPRVDLRWASADEFNADSLANLRDVVERLATAGGTCREVKGHAWSAVRCEDWKPGWEDEVHRSTTSLREAVETLGARARECSERLGLGKSGWSLDDLDLLRELTLTLMESPAPPTALLVRPDWEKIQAQVGSWIEHGQARDRIRAEVRERFRDEIVHLDLEHLMERVEKAKDSWWPASWWRRRPVRTALKGVALGAKAPTKDQLGEILTTARALREEQAQLDRSSDEARELLGSYWNDGEAEWSDVAEVRAWASGLRALARRAAGDDFDSGGELREKWARLGSEGRDLLDREASIGRQFVAFGDSLDAFQNARSAVVELLDVDVDQAWGNSQAVDALGRLRSSLTRWKDYARQLRDWCAWRRARSEAMRCNLAPLVERYESGDLESGQLRPVFERSYTQWWFGAVTDPEPVLSQFFSPEHERKIEQFREVDEHYMHLTRSLIQARLGEKVPASSSAVMPNSEMGILKREVGKKRRHMSVRRLLQKIPNLLPRLKPCLLMSPMSVAQYLDANFPPFDVVVFDEASQIPVWDAVGAIARGRHAVIVGDPRQLPPTSFFQRTDDDDEEEGDDVVQDLESILDDCIGAQIPWLPLDWHYRSRHESLITFSNYHYYGNRLLTFPSADRVGMGVSWRHVPQGVYDKGKTRTNREEAEAVVKEILRRFQDSELAQYSIGVVTFSQAQQTLIEDLLDEARAKDPSLDEYFSEDAEEPVFVKNLENVQGDERDAILFSICYGPDMHGRISMNFGPMNRDGGERRLNVAITRARREVIVFSTLRADQIDLARTRALGVKHLKAFIEYAERGHSAIAEATQFDRDADFDSPFEEQVYDATVRKGWEVHKQVGCARYRVDLAVVDPEAPGRYLLGVECDGANYHRAKTARDRDKLREGVLRNLGWNLHRVWSTDWWTNPEREVQKLEAALEQANQTESDPAGSTYSATPETIPIQISPPIDELERYQPIGTNQRAGSQAAYYEASSAHRIRAQILEVIVQEGPISVGLAAKRVAAFWGLGRVSSRAVDRVRKLVSRDEIQVKTDAGGEFLWPQDVNPWEYSSFRVPGIGGAGARDAEDLPLEEVANGVLHVLRSHIGAPVGEVVRETAKLFGFQRMGRRVDQRMRSSVDLLVESGRVTRTGDHLVICDQERASS